MNTRRTGHLGKTLDTGFDLFARNHHQISHLVDDDNDVRQRLGRELFTLEHWLACLIIKSGLNGAAEHLVLVLRLADTTVVTLNVANTHLGHLAIAFFHFAHSPLQRDNSLLGVGHNRRQQMRDAIIHGQFQHLGVDHNQTTFLWGQLVQQAQDHGVDRNRLTRPSRTRDEQVRHLGKVRNHRITTNVLTQSQRQTHVAVAKVTGRQDFTQNNLFADFIGQFDPDHRPTRHSRHTGRQGRH